VPKGKKTYCKKCKKHAAHKVTQYKTGKASLFAQGAFPGHPAGRRRTRGRTTWRDAPGTRAGASASARAASPPAASRASRPRNPKTSHTELLSPGKRRYDAKQSGYGGQTKPVFHKKARATTRLTHAGSAPARPPCALFARA
jgi:ribosomal protein L44E